MYTEQINEITEVYDNFLVYKGYLTQLHQCLQVGHPGIYKHILELLEIPHNTFGITKNNQKEQ